MKAMRGNESHDRLNMRADPYRHFYKQLEGINVLTPDMITFQLEETLASSEDESSGKLNS